MQRVFLKMLVIPLLMSLTAYGQSLGDIARQNREKQNAEQASGVQPKVIANQDLPRDPQPDAEPGETQPESDNTASVRATEHRSTEQRVAEQRRSEQWKRQILAQENRIADLQLRIDQLNASFHSAGGAQYEGPYNRYQARQLLRVAQTQQQLDEQKRRLDSLQEAARHAGMHTLVYDP